MQKEKKIRAYQRTTKSGKKVTVKAHTAKYDAAEKAKEMAKKKGAGDELEEKKKKKPVQLEFDFDFEDEKDKSKELVEKEVEKVEPKKKSAKKTDEKKSKKSEKQPTEKKTTEKKSTEKTTKTPSNGNLTAKDMKSMKADVSLSDVKKVAKNLGVSQRDALHYMDPNHEGFDVKRAKAVISKAKKYIAEKFGKDTAKRVDYSSGQDINYILGKGAKPNGYTDMGFTAKEFKSWYSGTGDAADKKVEKILRKKLGAKAYNELNDKAADTYTPRGHSKFFKSLCADCGSEKSVAKTPSKQRAGSLIR